MSDPYLRRRGTVLVRLLLVGRPFLLATERFMLDSQGRGAGIGRLSNLFGCGLLFACRATHCIELSRRRIEVLH